MAPRKTKSKTKTVSTVNKNAVSTIQQAVCGLVLMPASSKAVFYWFGVILGSFICDFLPLPQSYFSNRRNFFNVYFVKWSWGWTLCLLALHICLTSAVYTSCNICMIIRSLFRLVVGTFGWYLWVNLFLHIEQETGSCLGDRTITARVACRRQGFHWHGFDISGHTFLLIHCGLIIAEEMQIMRDWDSIVTSGKPRGAAKQKMEYWYSVVTPLVKALFLGTVALLILWEFMLACTVLYFHTVFQKVLGAVIAIFTWWITYKVWYNFDMSPGLPWKPQ